MEKVHELGLKHYITYEHIDVFVGEANILKLDGEVACIVNPTNTNLDHSGKLSSMLRKKGGDTYAEACKGIRGVEMTNCVVTTGGMLKTRDIMHAVCPTKDAYLFKQKLLENDIFATVLNCLKEAEKRAFVSIAFPFVSSGNAHVSIDICSKQYVAAILEFSRQRKNEMVCKRIYFVDICRKSVQQLLLTCTETLPQRQSQLLEINHSYAPVNGDNACQTSEKREHADTENGDKGNRDNSEKTGHASVNNDNERYDSEKWESTFCDSVDGKTSAEYASSLKTNTMTDSGYDIKAEVLGDCKVYVDNLRNDPENIEHAFCDSVGGISMEEYTRSKVNDMTDSGYDRTHNDSQNADINGKVEHSETTEFFDKEDNDGKSTSESKEDDENDDRSAHLVVTNKSYVIKIADGHEDEFDDGYNTILSTTVNVPHIREQNADNSKTPESSVTGGVRHSDTTCAIDGGHEEPHVPRFKDSTKGKYGRENEYKKEENLGLISGEITAVLTETTPTIEQNSDHYTVHINECKVNIYKGDIRNIMVDAIVCPEDLHCPYGGHGLMAASLKTVFRDSFKEEKLQKLTKRLFKKSTYTAVTPIKNNVKEGVRFLLHLATPFWHGDSESMEYEKALNRFEHNLHVHIKRAFDKVERFDDSRDIKTIAFPLMGIDNVDDKDAIRRSCRVMATCVKDFCNTQKQSVRVTEIHLVNRCPQITQLMFEWMQKLTE